ncbi:uroporphyrinogen-III C-methyltransferase [Naumannella halotolerans]|uniref:uroporphyrinogen-III C-methyltransferase n=1 Tax=Naumannella halotolerans TaxID=993414 RepID=A0A4R7JBG6_9ACTN|nr:uroporphyrinogen-III C-methyltransferase [Naumannella halotolerans]TDT34316.1 uroporphyrin-III C-methyltransferase [Naumannella halotolerans]
MVGDREDPAIGDQGAEPLPPTPAGWVSLVGGGPGDPGLLTGRAVRAIGEADVVLHDRLCPREALLDLAPGAELIDVGKRPGHHAMPQEEIERLMVDRARRGLRVVRLKGGDPFVFGRGGEEVLTCRRAGVPVEVVPGVSSAIAVPAAAGIPVTHRGVAHAFTVISAHAGLGEDELQQLAQLDGTIVVLMGVGTLDQVLDGLRRHGMSDHTPVAIIERGFSADERRLVSTIGAIGAQVPEFAPVSPAVIVIGAVVAALTENVSGSAPQCETDPDTKTVLGPVLQALGPS